MDKTWIALLRGVNVGGHGKIAMPELAAELSRLGLSGVRTHIQSGNLVFRCPTAGDTDLASRIGNAISQRFGVNTRVWLMRASQLAAAMDANPFPEAANAASGNTLHFFFLEHAPDARAPARLDAAATSGERWQLAQTVFYLHTPNGFGRSRLAARAEALLGVAATARNWRTLNAVLALAGEPQAGLPLPGA